MQLQAVTLFALVLCALASLQQASIIRNNQRSSYLLDQIQPVPVAAQNEYFEDPEESYVERQREPLTQPDCPGCARRQAAERQLSHEELRLAHIEMIKQQILEKLKLERPPNITVPRPAQLPEPLHIVELEAQEELNTQQENEDADDFYGKTTEVIVFADEVSNCHTTRPAGCFHFEMKESLLPDDVKTAELWVYKPTGSGFFGRNQTLVVSRLGNPNHSTTQVREVVDLQDTTLQRGWIKFDVRRPVRQWLHHPSTNHGLEVSCKECNWEDEESPVATQNELKPFIVIHTREQRHRRSKRSEHICQDDSELCCMESLTINFADIGWGSWIIQPTSYRANFCRGTCLDPGGGPWMPGSHYTAIRQRLANLDPDSALRQKLQPCCAPTRLGNLSLLVREADNQITLQNLAGMVVQSCDCM